MGDDAVVVAASLVLVIELIEDADEPGIVGERSGWAARDSCDPVLANCAPRDRERELLAKRPLSRLDVIVCIRCNAQSANDAWLNKCRCEDRTCTYLGSPGVVMVR